MKISNIIYEGVLLPFYCKNNNIDYTYIRTKLKHYQKGAEASLPLNIQIAMAINAYKNRRLIKYQWKNIPYKDTTLIKYCSDFNIIYNKIARRCQYYVHMGNNISSINDAKIDEFIQKYLFKEKIAYLKNKMNLLNKELTKKEVKLLCSELDINFRRVFNFKNPKFTIEEYLILTYFTGDKFNNGRYISKEKFRRLESNEKLDINDLIGLYKAGKSEYLETILENEKCYLRGFIFQTIKEYNFAISRFDYKDLYQQADLLLIDCINRIVYPEPGRIITYIKKRITKQMLSYLKENYSNKNLVYDDAIRYTN